MKPDTKYVNAILLKYLLGACVESFGLSHQFLTLTFRDSHTYDDHMLSIDTDLFSNCQDFDNLNSDENGRALLLFNSVNLQPIISIGCDDASTLKITFVNGTELIFNGSPTDVSVSEPWQLSNAITDGSYNIIAMHGGGYAVFETPSPTSNL